MISLLLAGYALAAPELKGPPPNKVNEQTHPALFVDPCTFRPIRYESPPELAACIGYVVPPDFLVSAEYQSIQIVYWEDQAQAQFAYGRQLESDVRKLKTRRKVTAVKTAVTITTVAVASLAVGLVGGRISAAF